MEPGLLWDVHICLMSLQSLHPFLHSDIHRKTPGQVHVLLNFEQFLKVIQLFHTLLILKALKFLLLDLPIVFTLNEVWMVRNKKRC